jgi:hypothetical protein
MSDRRILATFFPDEYARTMTVKEMTLDDIRDMALTATADRKVDLPYIKLARFGTKHSKNNCLRYNANMISVDGAEVDYDAQEMSFDEAAERLRGARLAAVLYTSPSNKPGAPRWRVILPTSRSLPPEGRAQLVARFNGLVNGVVAPESFTASQGFFIGKVNGNNCHRAEVFDGDYIDLRADLDAGAMGKKREPKLNAADNVIPFPSDYGRPSAPIEKMADPDLVFAALSVIPNNSADWLVWNETGMAAWVATNGAHRGFEAFDMWSRKSPEHNKEDTTQLRWAHYRTSPPTELGAGTLFWQADQAQPGWRKLVGFSIDKVTELLRLAKLAAAQYDPQRKETARRFGIRTATLDDVVAALRPPQDTGEENLQGGKIEFVPPEAWTDAVDGEQLVADMVKAIRDYIILGEHQALTVTLWVLHTYIFEVFEQTPRLSLKSPAMRCGKSTLLKVIGQMVSKALRTENISVAALFRVIAQDHPTMLFDEADNFFKNAQGQDNADLNGILNAGWEPDGTWTRTVGEDFEPRKFNVYAPVCFAWLVKKGVNVQPTLEDRSITIELRRAKPDEKHSRYRRSRTGHLVKLARRAARWCADHRAALVDADPKDMPEQLNDRAQDAWRPLIAIADAMSEALGKKIRDVAVRIEEEGLGGEEDISLQLLADVAAIFKKKIQTDGAERVPVIGSQEIVNTLAGMDERPWARWHRGEPISTQTLAKLLKAYNVAPRKKRVGQNLIRGYVPKAVLDAAERYVVEETEEETDEDAVPPL